MDPQAWKLLASSCHFEVKRPLDKLSSKDSKQEPHGCKDQLVGQVIAIGDLKKYFIPGNHFIKSGLTDLFSLHLCFRIIGSAEDQYYFSESLCSSREYVLGMIFLLLDIDFDDAKNLLSQSSEVMFTIPDTGIPDHDGEGADGGNGGDGAGNEGEGDDANGDGNDDDGQSENQQSDNSQHERHSDGEEEGDDYLGSEDSDGYNKENFMTEEQERNLESFNKMMDREYQREGLLYLVENNLGSFEKKNPPLAETTAKVQKFLLSS
jgi:hypothetical protein